MEQAHLLDDRGGRAREGGGLKFGAYLDADVTHGSLRAPRTF
jgi:hypothetical protein